jgi:ElaB/YqjD/DUF883 family membrane-anchored ribosome-binding protein
MNSETTNHAAPESQAFDEMRERLEKLSGEWQEQATQYVEQAKAWIIRYPGTSLAAAAGAGLLLGMMVKRK